MNAEQFLEQTASEHPPENSADVERFSAQLARRVADLLIEGAYHIDPEYAKAIEDAAPPGGWHTRALLSAYGANALWLEAQIQRGGHVLLTLQLPNGTTVWRATLRP